MSFLRDLLSTLREVLNPPPVSSREVIEIERAEGRLVVRSTVAVTEFDIRRRLIWRRGEVIARFSDIKAISVNRRDDEDRGTTWSVTLEISFFLALRIGVTHDDVDASILGARLSEVLGLPVNR